MGSIRLGMMDNEPQYGGLIDKYYIGKIILVCVLVVICISLIGAGEKFYLSQYHEECYKYIQIPYVANISYEDFKDGSLCYSPSGYWGLNCSIVTKYMFYNWTKDGHCSKYILVREAYE